MRSVCITCTALAALLLFTLFNSVWLSRRCSDWDDTLNRIDRCAVTGQWETAEAQLDALYRDWQSVQLWLHIIIEHEELDETEALFCRSVVLAEEEDSVEFRAHIADLRSQLQLLRELEELSMQNIL